MSIRVNSPARGVLFLVSAMLLAAPALKAQIVSDGATSVLSNVTNGFGGTITVGTNGSFTLLVLSNNCLLTNSAGGIIGHNPSATFNEARLVSSSARWFMGGSLVVGNFGAVNSLTVSNGGSIAANDMFIGFQPGSTNNRVVVNGGTLRVTNASGTSVLDVRRGTNVFNAGLIEVDRLLVTNFGSRFSLNGGTLITRNANMTTGFDSLLFSVGTAAGSEPAVWDVRAGATNMSISAFIPNIGRDSPFNRMLVTNGAVIIGGGAVLGEHPGAHSNSLVLSGGSRWIMSGVISAGGTGVCNRVVVSGAALSVDSTRLSFSSASTNNEAVVTGAGSVWTNISTLRLGFLGGGGNRFVIADGGLLVNNIALIGDNQSGGNEMWVTGSGSLCINSNSLQVGVFGNGNRLVITNGGTVTAGNLISLGSAVNSINNRIVVDGGTLSAANGRLDLRNGTNVFISGLVDVDSLSVTQGTGVFEFRGGTLRTRAGTISVGTNFVVGDSGAIPATWDIPGGSTLSNVRLPDNSQIVNGTYLPTDFDAASDSFPAPAPAGPYSLSFSNILGTSPNGAWSLFIRDDALVDTGSLNSWSVQIETSTGASTNAVFVGPVQIPDNTSASPYPATINIAGLSGLITRVTVMLSDLSHSFPDDLDVLLVGPAGQKVLLMSDTGGLFSVNVTLVFKHDRLASECTVSPPVIIGKDVAGCRLLLTNLYGALLAQQGVVVGLNPGSTANRVLIDGGQLRATNISGTATFDLRRGTNVLNAGLMDVDQLLLTNITGVLEFNGGTLIARSISANNGRVFRVGNGVDPATLQLPGGVHAFANSLEVLNQGTLVARGTVLGPVSLFNGSILSPGPFLGRLFFGDAPLLQGATVMEISKTGLTLTNDMIQVFWPLTYGGSLIVSNVGPSALTVSNRFQLFSATAYAGSFSSVTLPPLPPGQEWKNKLLVDGSIEVAAVPLQFSSIKLSGTNMIISGSNGIPGGNFRILTTTDLMRPVNLWDVLWVGQFDANGAFLLTNAMAPGESARFFRIRIP